MSGHGSVRWSIRVAWLAAFTLFAGLAMADVTTIKLGTALSATPKVALSADIVAKQQSMGPAGATTQKIDKVACYDPVVRAIAWPPDRPISQGSLYALALTCDFHQAKGTYGYREADLTFTFAGQTRIHDVYLAGHRPDQAGDRTVGIDDRLTFFEADGAPKTPHWKEFYQLDAPVGATRSRVAGTDGVVWSLDFDGAGGVATARVRQTGIVLIEVPQDQRKLSVTFSLGLVLDAGSPVGRTATAGPRTFDVELPEHAQEYHPSAWQ